MLVRWQQGDGTAATVRCTEVRTHPPPRTCSCWACAGRRTPSTDLRHAGPGHTRDDVVYLCDCAPAQPAWPQQPQEPAGELDAQHPQLRPARSQRPHRRPSGDAGRDRDQVTLTDLTTFATSWAPLLLSLAVVVERIWSRANGQLERKVDALHRRLDELRSFRDRVEGADCMDRLITVGAASATTRHWCVWTSGCRRWTIGWRSCWPCYSRGQP